VAEAQTDIDALISKASTNWRLDRMPSIDRAVLRLATFELGHRPDVPLGAVIDEAVELAKRYSTDDSGRFVNGILSRLAVELRADPDGDV
jgi:N utilization substance protein B